MADIVPTTANHHTPMLRGRHVTLVPLTREHVSGLCAVRADAGLDNLWFTNTPDVDGVSGDVDKALAAAARGTAFPFAVLDADGVIAGTTRLYGFEPDVPKVLIGYTGHAPRVQRTGLNTEAKLLLLRHAFETLDCTGACPQSPRGPRCVSAAAGPGARRRAYVGTVKTRNADRGPLKRNPKDRGAWPASRRYRSLMYRKYITLAVPCAANQAPPARSPRGLEAGPGVGFETSSNNERSRAAILRLGAGQDGILRHHKRHADGSPRDTVYFSIIDSEWPRVERDLRAKLAQHGNAP